MNISYWYLSGNMLFTAPSIGFRIWQYNWNFLEKDLGGWASACMMHVQETIMIYVLRAGMNIFVILCILGQIFSRDH